MAVQEEHQLAVPLGGDQLLKRKIRLIDLSHEIYEKSPLWWGYTPPFMMRNFTHDEFKKRWGTENGFEAHTWLLSEHTGTHVDGIFAYDPAGPPIDRTPLEYFYGEAICLDVSEVDYPAYVTIDILRSALASSGQDILPGDIVLFHTGHDRPYRMPEFGTDHTGLSRDAAVWLADKGVVNIGGDTPSVDHTDEPESPVHLVCKDYQIVITEALKNLHELVGKRFMFFGLPLKFRDGTASPVRAVAWVPGEE